MRYFRYIKSFSRLKHSGMTLLALSLAFVYSMAIAQTTNGTSPWMMRQTKEDSLWGYHHHLNSAYEADGKFQRMPSASKSGSGKLVSTMISPGNRKTVDDGTTTLQTNLPITNDQVYELLFDAKHNLIYLGGVFSYVGPNTGYGVALDTATGNVESGFPYVSGEVFAAAPDGSGGWYIGGSFTSVGGIKLFNLAHINADKSVDASWDPNPHDTVWALKVSGSTVYVGGEFNDGGVPGVTIGGADRNYIAAISASGTGSATSWNPNANGWVYALATSPDGDTVYAGGWFTALAGGTVTRNHIAAIDASTGNATSWDPNANDDVFGLAVSSDGKTVYAVGRFNGTGSIGGADRNHIAAIDASTGNATSWNPNVNNIVTALAFSADGTIIYCGGGFTKVGDSTRNQLAAISLSTGNATNWDPNVNGPVFSLAVSPNGTGGSTVYAGGDFTTLAGGAVARNRIAAIDASTGTVTSWNPNAGGDVGALAVSGSTVYACVAFPSVGGQTRNNIAAVDASTGNVTSWNPNANSTVSALALSPDGNTVYAGGSFTSVGAQTRNYIAAISASTGSATPWNPNANADVYALAVSPDGTIIYCGGGFSNVGDSTRNYIAAIAATGTGAATGWDPNANGGVFALALSPDGNTVYAGGGFGDFSGFLGTGTIGGAMRNGIAAIDANPSSITYGKAITTWNPNANGDVLALAVSSDGNTIYAGGDFTMLEGLTVTRSYIAAIDADGTLKGWNPNADGSVLALAVDGSTVYAAGWFRTLAGLTVTRGCIAAIDASGNATSWDPKLNPNGDDYVDAIALSFTNKRVYIGGLFQSVEGTDSYNFAGMDNPGDVSLPVQATDFNATSDVGSVTLSWSTQSEVNNAGFNVLRQSISDVGLRIADWETIANYKTDDGLKGLGTSTTGRAYQFVDTKVKSGAAYNYKIQSVNSQSMATSDLTTLSVTVDVPKSYALYQNYPNPFNPSTTIRFDLKEQSSVALDIYNVLGQRVLEYNYGTMNAGRYDENIYMDRFASGVYFYRIAAQGNDGEKFVSIKKLVLMK